MWSERIFIGVAAFLFLLSLRHLLGLREVTYAYHGVGVLGYNVLSWVLFAIVCLLMSRMFARREGRLQFFGVIGGFFLSVALVYGAYAHYVNDIFTDAKTILLQLGMILSLMAFTMPLTEEILLLLSRLEQKRLFGSERSQYRKVFWLSWLLLFISYLPIFLANWPGNFVFDGIYQLSEVLNNSYSTHHPLLHTLLMGEAYKLGLRMGNVSAGYQLYTLFQMVVLSGAFAYLVGYLYRRGAAGVLWVGSLLWYALFPMHALFAISSTKDVLFAAFFLLFMICLTMGFENTDHWKIKWACGLVASGIFLMLFRNNGVYAVAAGALLFAIFGRDTIRKRWGLLLLVVVMWIGYHCGGAILEKATHAVSKDTYRETLSVPLQCLGRVAAYRGNELDEELYEEICIYIPADSVSGYNPYISDPLKNNANEAALKSNLINFLKLWVKVGIKYPGEYAESVITNTLGYWYPGERGIFAEMDIRLYHMLIGTGHEIEKKSYCSWAEELYNYFFYQDHYVEAPLLGYLFRTDPYVWILFYVMLWGIYRRKRMVMRITLIPLFYLGTCFLGPVAALRYLYCLIVCFPLFAWSVMNIWTNKENLGIMSHDIDIKKETSMKIDNGGNV